MLARALKKKIIWSTFVQYFGKILQIALGIVAIKLVTTALGAEEFGVFGKISEFALFFSVFANLGIFGNVVRKMSEAPEDGKLFVNAMVLRVGSALFFFLIGVILSWFAFPEHNFALGVLFFLSALFFDYITTICSGMLQANYLMGRSVFAVTLSRVVELGIVLLLINSTLSTPFFFLAPLTASAVAMTLSLIFVRMRIKFVWELDMQMITMLFLTALPFGIINIINSLYYRFIPSFFAAKALTSEQFGSYNLVLSAITSVAIFSTFLMFSALPAFKQSIEEGHFQRARTMYKVIRRSLIALGILAIVSGSILGPTLLRLISNDSFLPPELWFMLPLFLVLTAVSYLYDLVLITLFALEKELWFLKWEFFALLIGGSILVASAIPSEAPIRLALILLGAIAGEGTMVFLGMRKIKKLLITSK